jgi:hypothetical protein
MASTTQIVAANMTRQRGAAAVAHAFEGGKARTVEYRSPGETRAIDDSPS